MKKSLIAFYMPMGRTSEVYINEGKTRIAAITVSSPYLPSVQKVEFSTDDNESLKLLKKSFNLTDGEMHEIASLVKKHFNKESSRDEDSSYVEMFK